MRNLEFTGMYYGENIRLRQVSKVTAKKLFKKGDPVLIQTSNFHPLGVWSKAIALDKGYEFDAQINNFKYYNCSSEMGRYVAYYQKLPY